MKRRAAASILLVGLLLGACSKEGTDPTPTDAGNQDLLAPRDSGTTGSPDLLPPKLTVPVNCEVAVVTAAQIYDPLFKASCSSNNCHGGPQVPSLRSAADLIALVGQSSSSSFAYVDSGHDVDKSYLLFKLAAEQNKVPRGGGQPMPPDSNLFDDNGLCRVINWVRSGAR